MRQKLLLAFTMLCIDVLNAQTRLLWNDVPEPPSEQGERAIIPAKYRTLSLNFNNMKTTLASAPMEFSLEARQTTFIIELPMPDGSFSKFQVEESPVMHPDLAAKHPDIKTYKGYGIDDGTATLRLDITPIGFHAMILSAETGTVFIDPYRRGDTQYYIAYYKKDFIAASRTRGDNFWQCRTDEQMNESVQRQINDMIASGNFPRTGDQLRTYRLAMTASRSYTNFHGSVANVSAAIVVSVNRVTGVYEKDFAIKMVLIPNNDTLILTNSSPNYPFTSENPTATMLNQNQTFIDGRIGTANYDIGHVVSTGDGGIAGLGVVCRIGNKARGATGRPQPIGDPFDIDYVAHEMGHQFGGNHTQNQSCNRVSSAAYEPGSASTIMGYAGICPPDIQPNSDDYFHVHSIIEIRNYIAGSGGSCPVVTPTGNAVPTATFGQNGFTIPIQTPFTITGSGSDADNDTLTYCWEQYDLGAAGAPSATATTGPVFRSILPSLSPSRTFPRQQELLNNTTNIGETFPTVSRALNFRLTVRDRKGGVFFTPTSYIVNTNSTAGPFVLTNPNTSSVEWRATERRAITWNVANTNVAPVNCQNVNILLSTNGGVTFPITLASNTPNDGIDSITVPFVITDNARVKVEAADNIFFDISNANFKIIRPLVAVDLSAISIAPKNLAVNGIANQAVVTVRNEGLNALSTYNVSWSLDNVLQGTRTISRNLASVATDTIQFDWTSPAFGARTLKSWTSLSGDTIRLNDTAQAVVNVQPAFSDAGATSIAQTGEIIATNPTTLTVNARNFGTLNIPSYQVNWTVDGAAQPARTISRNLIPNATDTIQLVWTPTNGGAKLIKAWTTLVGDTLRANDTATISRNVLPAYQDLGITAVAPRFSLASGFPNVLIATSRSFGTLPVGSYQAGWSLNGAVQSTRTITRTLNRNQTDTIEFNWANPPAGNQVVKIWATNAADTVRSNDTTTVNLNVILSFVDGQAVSIATETPPREADITRLITRIRNNGTVDFLSYNVTWAVDDTILGSRLISRVLTANSEDTAQFLWQSPLPGTRRLSAWVRVQGDTVIFNDTARANVTVAPFAAPIAAWSNGFEDAVFPPAGWSLYAPPGQQNWIRSSSSAFRIFGLSSTIVRAEINTAVRNDAWLISPRTAVSPTSTLAFYAKRSTLGGVLRQDSLRVKISTTGAGTLNFGAPIRTLLPTSAAEGERVEIPLNNFAGQNIFIAFHYNEQAQSILVLDSISVDSRSSTPIASEPNRPARYDLEQNYPNPFNPSTLIRYELSALSEVKLEVFDVIGRRVAVLVNAAQQAGRYQANFNAANLASGIYFYRLQANSKQNSFAKTMRMLLVK